MDPSGVLRAIALALTLALGACAAEAEAEKDPAGITDRELEREAAALRAELGPEFTVLVEKPFVVAGDENALMVRSRAVRIVRWAATLLRKDYFAQDPDAIYRIYLFKDKDSYRTNAKRLFHEEPDTPYGYCSPANRALVMNIATGGGTLVHEMVHSFMHGNVRGCPDWINEGLASLYEASGERDGHLIGMVNWRLAGLKEGLADGTAPTWEQLAALDSDGFYGAHSGRNYAVARYLLLWLQEHGQLATFWRQWTAHRDGDPTGIKTLAALFPHEELPAVQERWKRWVATLGE
jgi:hypothetical protein